MRYLLIFIGAAVVAYLLAMGIRAFMAGRQTKDDANAAAALGDPQPSEPKRAAYRIK